MERWTRWTVRAIAGPFVAVWLAAFSLAGGYSSSKLLGTPLEHVHDAAVTDSERARTILEQHYGDRSDGAFTVVFRVPTPAEPGLRVRLQRQPRRRRRRCRAGRPARSSPSAATTVPLRRHRLDPRASRRRRATPTRSCARFRTGGGVDSFVTGQARDPARPRPDLRPRILQKGEFRSRSPIALLVLLLVFGLSLAGHDPADLRGLHDHGHARVVYLFAHEITMATYVTNLGPADQARHRDRLLAPDRLPLPRELPRTEARRTTRSSGTMATAGRAVSLLGRRRSRSGSRSCCFMPSPFMRSMGVGGFLIRSSRSSRADAAAGAAPRSTGGAGRDSRPVCARWRVRTARGFWSGSQPRSCARPAAVPGDGCRGASWSRRCRPSRSR